MSDTPTRDYRDTVFLPRTDFPMKAGLAAAEPAWLARWQAEGLYAQLRETRAGRKRFILHDGPPYANGDIHMGHAMNKVLKDLIVRSQSMLGKDAPYIPGWDCHGLPIEWKVEEKYRAKKLDKDAVPVAEFRAECRAYASDWVAKQRGQFERLGVLGDWDDPYLTMNYASEATIVAELLKFATSGQLYRGAKPVMWSPVEKTALAEAEVEYADITSTQIDVAFEIMEAPNAPELKGAFAVIWTTTPWTIPVNQAIAYGPEVSYTVLHAGDERYLVAAALAETFIERTGIAVSKSTPLLPVKIGDEVGIFAGDDKSFYSSPGNVLAGTIARHPMHHLGGFFARPRPFLAGDFVTTDAGTGLVHMAPDHGEDDFLLCKANGIDPVFAVEGDGRYRADWAWLGGQGSVIAPKLNAPDGPICSDLRSVGALVAASADYSHSYPHSWRSHAKLIFRATPQWFIPMDEPHAAPSTMQEHGPPPPKTGEDRASSHSAPPSSPGEGDHAAWHGGGGGSNADTLREVALDAIERTRWVPERSKNRITAMVAGRPDWVISRQRAWGVPITLFVDRRTGEYLRDAAVNARIVAAVEASGADAWWATDPAHFLGEDRDPANYERVDDILDVWFDSGSTHAFVIEARYGIGTRADLYVEGSDQHRGWFQSSLLESSGTRGRAPYDAVLTHGFALDSNGKKMSKSLGNTVDPLKIVETQGADILRLWVASTAYFDDVKIGKEVLAGQTDVYRKLRNTFRYLLGALDGWDEAERVAVADMPELERWVLHRVAELDAELRIHVANFDFNPMMTAINAFANADLSAFYFDIRKDSLYCDAPSSLKRRACRTVLDTLFHALVRWLSPVLVFTAEEVWRTRFPDAGSVHLGEWADYSNIIPLEDSAFLHSRWLAVRQWRYDINVQLEALRRAKVIGSSMEAGVTIFRPGGMPDTFVGLPFAETLLVASVEWVDAPASADAYLFTDYARNPSPVRLGFSVWRTSDAKCDRCRRYLPDVAPETALCTRCAEVVDAG